MLKHVQYLLNGFQAQMKTSHHKHAALINHGISVLYHPLKQSKLFVRYKMISEILVKNNSNCNIQGHSSKPLTHSVMLNLSGFCLWSKKEKGTEFYLTTFLSQKILFFLQDYLQRKGRQPSVVLQLRYTLFRDMFRITTLPMIYPYSTHVQEL